MKEYAVVPRASLLIESMRSIGYTLEAALADIIDNSITAGAVTIRILVDTNSMRIGILDDGRGMTETELFEAMRPGSKSPLQERSENDLGRFGLGLKTASFSQCRSLTVVTRRDQETHVAEWDLDHVALMDDWLIRVPDDFLSVTWADILGDHGTLVVWDKLDRVKPAGTGSQGPQDFIRCVDDAREHLELTFHRFLSGEPGTKRIRISINERPLEPFDPFHSKHNATDHGPVEIIQLGGVPVTVQTFTLPHHRNVTASDWERYAGRAGYVRNQGFYVYREKRLIIHGTWFGLARQSELTKLARVRIDMPSRLDAEWQVDVRKSSAHPPRRVKERLRRIIETIGAGSKRAYTSRGKKLVADGWLPVWRRIQINNTITYQINADHPVVSSFVTKLPEDLKRDFHRIVEITGAALPMDAIFADIGENPDQLCGILTSDDSLRHAVMATYNQLIRVKLSINDIKEMMRSAEPFRSNWSPTEQILDEIAQQESGP